MTSQMSLLKFLIIGEKNNYLNGLVVKPRYFQIYTFYSQQVMSRYNCSFSECENAYKNFTND